MINSAVFSDEKPFLPVAGRPWPAHRGANLALTGIEILETGEPVATLEEAKDLAWKMAAILSHRQYAQHSKLSTAEPLVYTTKPDEARAAGYEVAPSPVAPAIEKKLVWKCWVSNIAIG